MDLADDIQQLRSAGKSDKEIMEGLKTFKPEWAGDIDKAVSAGKSPTDIVNGATTFKDAPQQSTAANVMDAAKSAAAPLQQGISDYATGVSNTLKEIGQGGQSAQVAGDIGKAIAPSNYQQPHFDWRHPIDTAGEIPKAIEQSLPELGIHSVTGAGGAALGGAVGGPVGAALGGGAGVLGSYLLGHYANDKATAKAANPGISDDDATKKALEAGAANAIMYRLGIPGVGGTVAKAGENAVGHTLGEMATSGAKMGAMNVGQDAANKSILTGQTPTLDDVANQFITGAATGAGVRALNIPKDVNIASKNADITPEAGANLAQHILELNGGNVPQGPREAYDALTKTRDNLSDLAEGLTTKDPASEIKNHLKSLTDIDVNNPTPMTLTRVQSAIKRGDGAKPEDIQSLRDTLGQTARGAEYVDTLDKQSSLNQLLGQGVLNDKAGTFSSGLSSSPSVQDWLSPTGAHGKYLGWAPLVGALFGVHLPGPLGHAAMQSGPLAGMVGQFGTKKTLQVVDAALGNTNPLKNFMERYSDGSVGSPDYSNLPSFTEQLRQAKAEQLAKDQAANASQQAQQTQDKASAKLDAKTKEDVDAWTAKLALKRLAAQRATNPGNIQGYGESLPQPDTAPVAIDPALQKINKGAQQIAAQAARSQVSANRTMQKATTKGPKTSSTGEPSSNQGSTPPPPPSANGGETVTAHNPLTGETIKRQAEIRLTKPQYESGMQGRVEARAGIIRQAMQQFSSDPKIHEQLKGLSQKLDSVNNPTVAEHHINEAVDKMNLHPVVKKAMRTHLMGLKKTWHRSSSKKKHE